MVPTAIIQGVAAFGTEQPTGPDGNGRPLAYRVVRGSLWLALSSYFQLVWGFGANLILTRLLEPQHFGTYALALFWFSLLNLRPKLGIGQAFAQRKETTPELAGTHLTLDLTAGLVTLLLLGAAVPVLIGLGYPPELGWVVLALGAVGLVEAAGATAIILLDKNLLFHRSALVQGLAFGASYLPGFWVALNGGGYWSIVVQNAALAALTTLGTWWAARGLPAAAVRRWRFDPRLARELIRFGLVVGMATLGAMFLTQLDNFLVGTFVGLAALGFYDRAYRTAQWPANLLNVVVNRGAFYTYARLRDDPARLHRTGTMLLWLILMGGIPLAIAVAIAAPELITVLYGDRWLPVAPILRLLVVYSVCRPLWDNAASLFTALGRPGLNTVFTAAQAVILAAAGLPLTLLWQTTGTALAMGLAFGLGLALTYREVLRQTGINLGAELRPAALAGAAIGAGYWLLSGLPLLGGLGVEARLGLKFGYAFGGFWLLAVGLSPRLVLGRLGYVIRLLRAD